ETTMLSRCSLLPRVAAIDRESLLACTKHERAALARWLCKASLFILLVARAVAAQDCIDYKGYLHWVGSAGGAKLCVDVSGAYAYVGVDAGLQVIDISIPASPHVVAEVATPDAAVGVAVSGRYAYAVTRAELLIIDVSSSSSPFIAGSVGTPGA